MRTNTYKLDWDALLVWFEGDSFRVPIKYEGDKLYNERAPIFASSSSKLRISKWEAQSLGVNEAAQNDMMDVRWRYFYHSASIALRVECAPCTRCFSEWLSTDELVALT